MNPENGKCNPIKAGKQIELIALLASCLAVPLHGQQKALGADTAGSANQPASANSQPSTPMLYNRLWFDRDRYGFTLGGGKINNPGRYLVLLPPINGATAATGTPYFPENPGDPYKAWDASATFDYMPSQYITFRTEYDHRAANVPYFTGRGGVTPPGGNNGNPGVIVPGWSPDLVRDENRMDLAILVKF